MRFILTIGIDLPAESRLSNVLMDEEASLSDVDAEMLKGGIGRASNVSVLGVEVIDTDE